MVLLIFFQELADYEKMPNGPKLTEKDLEEHGYNGPRPFFECLVAFDPSKPDVLIGFVLFFYTYSTWDGPSVFMEDLYVTPASRGQGLGTKLWQGVVQVFFPQNHFTKFFVKLISRKNLIIRIIFTLFGT